MPTVTVLRMEDRYGVLLGGSSLEAADRSEGSSALRTQRRKPCNYAISGKRGSRRKRLLVPYKQEVPGSSPGPPISCPP